MRSLLMGRAKTGNGPSRRDVLSRLLGMAGLLLGGKSEAKSIAGGLRRRASCDSAERCRQVRDGEIGLAEFCKMEVRRCREAQRGLTEIRFPDLSLYSDKQIGRMRRGEEPGEPEWKDRKAKS
jgi:hypothetical protein